MSVALLLGALLAAVPAASTVVVVRAGDSTADVVRVGHIDAELRALLQHRALDAPVADDPALRQAAAEALGRCGSDLSCTRVAFSHAGIALLCAVDVDRAEAIATVTFLEREAGLVGTRTVPIAELDEVGLSRRVAASAGDILDRWGRPALGRLRVQVTPPDAQVSAAGLQPEPDAHVWRGPPGTYRVEVRREGHLPEVHEVLLVGGRTDELVVTLSPDSSLWSTPWPWVAIGVATAVAGGVVWAVASRESCGCVETTPGACTGCR